jgi:hypothetical protein
MDEAYGQRKTNLIALLVELPYECVLFAVRVWQVHISSEGCSAQLADWTCMY